MVKFGQEAPDKPIIPSLEVRKLRAKLILEEALECIEALGFVPYVDGHGEEEDFNIFKSYDFKFTELHKVSLTLLSDGLADLHYVAYCGTANACGIDMEPIFQEVHHSNMSKLWTEDEVDIYLEDSNYTVTEVQDKSDTVKIYLVKDKYGKVIKSPSYSSANIKQILDAQSAK